jgi:hypothetical protein
VGFQPPVVDPEESVGIGEDPLIEDRDAMMLPWLAHLDLKNTDSPYAAELCP